MPRPFSTHEQDIIPSQPIALELTTGHQPHTHLTTSKGAFLMIRDIPLPVSCERSRPQLTSHAHIAIATMYPAATPSVTLLVNLCACPQDRQVDHGENLSRTSAYHLARKDHPTA